MFNLCPIIAMLLLAVGAAQAQTRSGSLASVNSYQSDTFKDGGENRLHAAVNVTDWRGSVGVATANVRDGALHAFAAASTAVQPDCNPKLSNTCGWSITATAQVWDVLTFVRSDLADPSEVHWKWAIDGFFNWGPYGRGGEARFSYYVGDDPYGWARPRSAQITPRSQSLSQTFAGANIMPNDRSLTLYVYAAVEATGYTGGTADFSHTARFGLELPAGVTFTSRSGAFMADHFPPAPVPEPQTWALLAAGLLTLPALRRRMAVRG